MLHYRGSNYIIFDTKGNLQSATMSVRKVGVAK